MKKKIKLFLQLLSRQLRGEKKKIVSANSFKQLLFSLYWHILVDMRANFWEVVNISLNMNYVTC